MRVQLLTTLLLIQVHCYATDLNLNGMSDVYEGMYGLPSHPLADSDGDGLSNAAEYVMGGNPLLNGDLSNFGASVINNASFPVLSWTGAQFMRYQVQRSSDLISWVDDSGVSLSAGQTQTYILSVAISAGKGFWRVRCLGALDSDSDGHNDWEELVLGTDPNVLDSDRDGVNDGMDAYPLDPLRSEPLVFDVNDSTAPSITLIQPSPVTLIP